MVAFVTIKDQQTIATIRSLGYIIYQYYADIWVSVFTGYAHKHRKARKASISDATKREYAAATGADLDALLGDCAYKEQHRPALTAFFKEQMRQQPQLPEKHFLNVLSDAADMDQRGTTWSEGFANKCLLPLFHKDLERLASMVVPVPDFPRPGIEFRHVLNIAQRQGGLALCTSLLRTRFKGDWVKVGAVACCEAGGFVYASALAQQVDVPLALIRGKLPPPTVSVKKPSSHISCSEPNDVGRKRIERSQDLIPRGASVVVIGDVLATGKTLCAVLQLLAEAGISHENISIMVVAEFPIHCGRELLYHRGFGAISIQCLLVFDGV
ncbi:hypothetical protein FocTR4_00017241 [Fusarium oxysporum f. sp. cubense]|uniref:adenine phosphoribosyltransferase n=1 Tax=Fusarium oxysporum f. sp. cubense TaxID=61366 RepID=A0A5C6TPU2_FUSOC|nr:hypothetical protein FocTR4_00017241 [Fusarium oxysporum f. sp. cubense]